MRIGDDGTRQEQGDGDELRARGLVHGMAWSVRPLRYFLDLALADFRGSRAHLTARLRDELAAHLIAEPTPPIEPAIIEEPNPFEHRDAATPETEPGRWAPDPSGRFAQRWWDGQSWTEHVTDTHGTVRSDALEPARVDTST